MLKQNTGIPTLFRGIEYRSRLEARWAAFFHEIDWSFTYEPFDGDGYIPDFVVDNGDEQFIVEIKPAVTEDDYRNMDWDKINHGLENHWQRAVFIGGVSPLPRTWESKHMDSVAGPLAYRNAGHCDECIRPYLVAGDPDDVLDYNDPYSNDNFVGACEHWRWWWSYDSFYGHWCFNEKENLSISIAFQSWTRRRAARQIEKAWASATNDVKWRATSA